MSVYRHVLSQNITDPPEASGSLPTPCISRLLPSHNRYGVFANVPGVQKAAHHRNRQRSLLSHGVDLAPGPHQRRATQTLRGCQGPAQAARALQGHACQQDWMRAWQARSACAGTPGNPSAHLFASRCLAREFSWQALQCRVPCCTLQKARKSKQCTSASLSTCFLALPVEMQPARTVAGRVRTAPQALSLHRRRPQLSCSLQRTRLACRGQTFSEGL